ncbi:kelch repeat-containing protein, partial [Planctomycetota bacterium]
VEEYDPVMDTWTRKTDMPTARLGHSASVVSGKIYVIAGDLRSMQSSATVEEYDPETDTWTRKADMPTRRTFLCSCVVDGKIYVMGGITAPEMHESSALEVYDPATDTWTRKADMPTARSMLSASVVDGKIYTMGGVQRLMSGPGISIVEEYDPINDTWTRKTDMPTERKNLSTFAVSGKIYAVGGGTGIYGPTYSAVEEYDPKTDIWAKKSNMPTTRWLFSVSLVNGRVYAIGGSVQDPHVAVSLVEEFDIGFSASQPDFNGDGIVDIKDLLRLIESWGQDDLLVDIAPSPFGDGVVDVLDLELLMSYWEQPFDDPTLIAHWALDEMEGIVAYDSAGVNDAFLIGGTSWQPSSGQVDGALQLDGIDGCAVAGPVLNPANGPFSVLAWIQGGGPGQVVISQLNGFDWLGTDPSSGRLMTELCLLGRSGGPLQSETVITDGVWHRIGLVWDGANRILYVDDIQVAEDTQDGLESSNSGLYIGTDKLMTAGTYWFGLIDDVRIYNRAVRP